MQPRREREAKKGRETKKEREQERGREVRQRSKEAIRDSEIWSAKGGRRTRREREREEQFVQKPQSRSKSFNARERERD